MTIAQKVRKIIEEGAKKKSNKYEMTGFEHILTVVKFAKILAKKRKADVEVTELSALFHDYASLLENGKYVEEHEIHSAIKAEEILTKFRYPKEKIEIIKDAIYCHRGSKGREKKTVEARCLADADAMAHFNAIPSLFYLAYITYKISDIEEAKKFIRDKLSRSWNKLSPDAREIIKKEYAVAKVILE